MTTAAELWAAYVRAVREHERDPLNREAWAAEREAWLAWRDAVEPAAVAGEYSVVWARILT